MYLDARSIPGVLRALAGEVAAVVAARGGSLEPGSIPVLIAGSSAGMLGELFPPLRTTVDRDVAWVMRRPEDAMLLAVLEAAGDRVGRRLDLPSEWLNRKCSVFAWSWPLGWEDRCAPVEGDFGLLSVRRLSRFDLIAAKIFSGPRRPRDRQDLVDLAPSHAELDLVEEHFDRLRAEGLGRNEFEEQSALVRLLRERAP
jgi:hypothetical protein